MAYYPPNPKKLAWQREQVVREQRRREAELAHAEYLTPQERQLRGVYRKPTRSRGRRVTALVR